MTVRSRVKTITGWFGISIICPNVAICLPAYCCFSELVLHTSK